MKEQKLHDFYEEIDILNKLLNAMQKCSNRNGLLYKTCVVIHNFYVRRLNAQMKELNLIDSDIEPLKFIKK